MPARRLDGTAWAERLRTELEPRVAAVRRHAGRPPGLAVVLAGTHPPSEIYVRNKIATAQAHGCHAVLHRLPETASVDEALSLVRQLNADGTVDGILVQSPLPTGMGPDAESRLFDAVDPAKDVDGFHPVNVGRLVQKRPALVACTPLGCATLLDREEIPLRGRHAVVIGRSDIVGKPMALLLMHRDATVTICHSRTVDLPAVCRTADVLVAAIGRPGFVTPDFVKPGATVIDVGINRVETAAVAEALFAQGSSKRAQFEAKGHVLVGDVHPGVADVAGALTPVPGGVGPLTIAMVLTNTVTAAEWRLGLPR
jgi:methylenetetrahydrofolate dehydrogenase (NADP+)/methenyltetrahydrofolate cyclohydrolase